MKILALEKNVAGVSTAAFTVELLREEAARVWHLQQSGVIREIYFRADRRVSVLVLECADLDGAREAIATLPLVQERLINFELIPLVPYTGFERLFV